MLTTYLFDLDGTLIDEEIYTRIYKPVIAAIRKRMGVSEEQLFRKVSVCGLKKNRLGRYDTGELSKELGTLDIYYKILEKAIKPKTQVYKKIDDLFSSLKKRKKTIGIVSNSMQRTIILFLKKYKLQKKVDFVFAAELVGRKKDSEEFWHSLISENYLNPHECLMVGDDFIEDITIPQKLGFCTYHITDPVKELERIKHVD